MSCFNKQLLCYATAGIPVVSVITHEWQRLQGFCVGVSKKLQRNFYVWSQISGVKRWDDKTKSFQQLEDLKDPMSVLEWFGNPSQQNLILLLEDFHPFLKEEHHPVIRLVRELTRTNPSQKKVLLLQTISMLHIPEFEKEIPILELLSPQEDTLLKIIEASVYDLDYDSKPNEVEAKAIASASLGMSSVEAEWTYKTIIAEKERLTLNEIPFIIQEKEQIIKKGGILEYFHPEGDFRQVGGMENLKKWLQQRGRAFSQDAKQYGLKPPKGAMLLGIPGCGKSLLAKTIANEWDLPLLKFDLGKVFGGTVGESEANIRQALQLAETVAPSILWIDEIEKGLSGLSGSGDSGTSARVFGHLLTWMQDKKSEVFVVATANNIEQLPPELLRKGRFDEIFFVDLPCSQEREDILRIHLEKVKRCPQDFNLTSLAQQSLGFSGAEIEEAVSEAMFSAYAQGDEVSTQELEEAIKNTYPLSKTMREPIQKLKEWAKVRARFASVQHNEVIPKDQGDTPILKQEKHNPFV